MELGNNLSICIKIEGGQENMCRDEHSQNLPDVCLYLADSELQNIEVPVYFCNNCSPALFMSKMLCICFDHSTGLSPQHLLNRVHVSNLYLSLTLIYAKWYLKIKF
jgi:hypothetical protein